MIAFINNIFSRIRNSPLIKKTPLYPNIDRTSERTVLSLFKIHFITCFPLLVFTHFILDFHSNHVFIRQFVFILLFNKYKYVVIIGRSLPSVESSLNRIEKQAAWD